MDDCISRYNQVADEQRGLSNCMSSVPFVYGERSTHKLAREVYAEIAVYYTNHKQSNFKFIFPVGGFGARTNLMNFYLVIYLLLRQKNSVPFC
jgi:hypothetical protein